MDEAAGAVEAVELEELELSFELVAEVELSEDFDVSPPDFASVLLADAGFAEE